MRTFPLRPFLLSLEAESEEIRLTVGDYERLLRAFNCGGDWSLTRLKHTLCALLAKNQDQQRLIERKFDEAFGPESDTPDFDIRQVLDELRELPPQTPPLSKKPAPVNTPQPSAKKRRPQTAAALHRRARLLKQAAAAILLLCAAFGAWQFRAWRQKKNVPHGPSLELRPGSLNFGEQTPGGDTERTMLLINSGSEPLRIEEILLHEAAPEDFYLDFPELPLELPPGAEYKLTAHFRPDEESCRDGQEESGRVEILHNGDPQAGGSVALAGTGVIELSARPQTRTYAGVPSVTQIDYVPLAGSRFWLWPAGLFLLFAAGWGAYAAWLRRLERGPQDRKPEIDMQAPRMFRSGAIGGAPRPWLDHDTLDELADSMGYFKSPDTGRRLDVAASIRATVRGGGIPVCRFLRRSRVRTLLILEDAGAGALDWNPLPRELAEGMRRCGVPVMHGRFYGAPDSFVSDGRRYDLEDFEDRRRGILLLLFSDGHALCRPRCRFAFEHLAHWPMAAWMELSERHADREGVQALFGDRLPAFPATRQGVLSAVKRFLSEAGDAPRDHALRRSASSKRKNSPPGPLSYEERGSTENRVSSPSLLKRGGQGVSFPEDASAPDSTALNTSSTLRVEGTRSVGTNSPPSPLSYEERGDMEDRISSPSLLKRGGQGVSLPKAPFAPDSTALKRGPEGLSAARVERLLGDALPWAQDCSLIQPIPLGLADALRLKFYETLPPERLGRLLALPNCARTAAGLRFSHETQAMLRRGLSKRRNAAELRERQEFLLRHLEQARPELPRDSLAYLTWEACYERLRLETGDDPELKRLGELQQSPLGKLLAGSLQGYAPAGTSDSGKIPLLPATPGNTNARQRLRRLPGNPLGLRPPLERRHILARRGLALLCALCGLATAAAFFHIPPFAAKQLPPNLHVSGSTDAPARLEVWENDEWQLAGEWEQALALNTESLEENREYRLRLYGKGIWVDVEEFGIPAGKQARMEILSGDAVKTCRENFPEIGLQAERCPEPSSGTAQDRPLSEQPGNAIQAAPEAQQQTDVPAMRVGLELSSAAEDAGQDDRALLLADGRFDLIYRLSPAPDGEWRIQEAFEKIRNDLWPWMAESELSWWTSGPEMQQFTQLQFEGFAAVLEYPFLEAIAAAQHASPSMPPAAPLLEEWTEAALTGMEFVKIPAGCFMMGQTEEEREQLIDDIGKDDYEKYYQNELPRHEVCLKEFWMGRYEVTQQEWERVMGENPSRFTSEKVGKGAARHPVEQVSWDDIQKFLDRLNSQALPPSDLPKGRFQLPSEAQWEYACRAGTETPFSFGETIDTAQANYHGNYVYGKGRKGEYRERTTPVGSFPPNAFGLYDMHGNVWEWNADPWHDSYAGAPDDGRVWEEDGDVNRRLLRGGSWNNLPINLRCANRPWNHPDLRNLNPGFRVVFSSPRTL